ncbi:MAG: hypothetical protein JWR18_3581 [Segetibacter sp.]|jgi:uncharacterized protein HemX|nr:hypothetical protein [Segetibacter sp.]
MILQKDQFPVTIQAFEITGDVELFIAEQVVNSQAEIDTFSNKYAGKLIKVKALSTTTHASTNTSTATRNHPRKSNVGTIIIVILIILIILAAIGFYTGWIQQNTGIAL